MSERNGTGADCESASSTSSTSDSRDGWDFGFGVAPRLVRAGAEGLRGVSIGIGDVGGRFLNRSEERRGTESGAMVLGSGCERSIILTSITSICPSRVSALDAFTMALGPGGVDGIRSSMLFSSRSLSEQSEGVVTSVSLVGSGRGGREILDNNDISDDDAAVCWLIPDKEDGCVIRRFAVQYQ